jgi:hypothetical protein
MKKLMLYKQLFKKHTLIFRVFGLILVLSIGILIGSKLPRLNLNKVSTSDSTEEASKATPPTEERLREILNIKETESTVQPQYTDEPTGDSRNDFYESMKEGCKRKQEQYDSCLTEYNAASIEYQNCRMGGNTFGCTYAPTNNCYQYKPSSYCN